MNFAFHPAVTKAPGDNDTIQIFEHSVDIFLVDIFGVNPFDRNLPWFPLDGGDLNPLLQDPGLIIHPPMLYMGYVGFSVAFAFAIAGLLAGRLDPDWARWARPWTTVAWSFLTIGIALGSWWAYYELGWGGWWFWDPVENASLMPWLCGTALIHSLAVTERRGLFRAWTVLLAIMAFSLCLLGTFLVRSGVLTSVHSFANDPARGAFILAFLLIVVGGSLTLFAVRAPVLRHRAGFEWLSRDSFLLGNNLILLVATFVVLMGTLFPLLGEAMDIKISVRSPYFNAFFVPLTLVLMLLMVPGMLSNWKKQDSRALVRRLVVLAPVSIVMGVLWVAVTGGKLPFVAILAIVLVAFVILAQVSDWWIKARAFRVGVLRGSRRLHRAYYGMITAHIGLAILVAGITQVSFREVERDVRMTPGEMIEMAGYQFEFSELTEREGPNFDAIRGVFSVSSGDRAVTVLTPEKRTYRVSGQVMTEAAIHSRPARDLYVALGEPIDDTAWAVRVYYKPGIGWLWLGSGLLALGGFMAATDRRYRRRGQDGEKENEHAAA
ncbi:MAG: heme lyase NrfEFG subunit NrfE [Gammaproteobacteria bacterium HGW-Gammaproteobacteria-14]|nr:MAG: heme lyase NrfEFG subunit NrfE [Gammaproteobacteria bacterium HGW-Gammaproteobacteria-14]